jgi:hypothetical protein
MGVTVMMNCKTLRCLAVAATLICGAGAASALPVVVTLDFGTTTGRVSSPYVEDGFEVRGLGLSLSGVGNPAASIFLDSVTRFMELSRVGGGTFSLIRFDYFCDEDCGFSVGGTPITGRSLSATSIFATASPTGFTDITSVVFTRTTSNNRIDNIVLSYDDGVTAIPLPAGLPLLLGGLAGLGLIARPKSKAA